MMEVEWPTQTRIKVQILQQKKIKSNITIIIAIIICSGGKLLQVAFQSSSFNTSSLLQLLSLLLSSEYGWAS